MTSAATPSKPPQQPPQQQTSPPQQHVQAPTNPTSPPSKRDLKSWWKRFQTQSKHHDTRGKAATDTIDGQSHPSISNEALPVHVGGASAWLTWFFSETRPPGIFGVPLRQSITYANVAISLVDDDGKSYIYGYVPIVVAKCGVFLKEKATGVEGIFRLSGSEKRIKELKLAFDSPDRYGKGLVWDGYTVHDAANVLRRYLNDLPEPVVPLELYKKFRDPLRGHTRQAVGDTEGTQLVENFNEMEAITKYQALIKDLPPLNRQLLLYILDLLAVFAAKADENRMTAQNLAAIFQPGMLSHPAHAMAPEEYRLNQCVIIFLIENQDHFLIGMQGTAADEKTKQDIENGTPPIVSPSTPSRKSGVARSASSASAGAESVSRDGKIRRNRSTSSRHSRHSNGASTPNSPALVSTASGGLARSNTVPSKKSPNIASARFNRHDSPAVAIAPASPSPIGLSLAPPSTVSEEAAPASERHSPATSSVTPMVSGSTLMPIPSAAARSQEGLLEPTLEAATPAKERAALQNLFQRSPTSDSEKRQPNKLRKKRMPGSANPSAQSSTASLTDSGAISPAVEPSSQPEKTAYLEQSVPENAPLTETPSEPTPRASQVPSVPSASAFPAPASESNRSLKPKNSPSTSLHSSFNEGSDLDQVEDTLPAPTLTTSEQADKEKKRRWRISRRKEEMIPTSPAQNLGANSHAEASTSSIGSGGHRPRKSWTGESSDVAATIAESEAGSRDTRDESRGPLGWIKSKYREAKENADHKRTKSPPGESGHGSHGSHGSISFRGKSLDIKRSNEEKRGAHPSQMPADIPLPMSPPPVPRTHDERPRAP
ncbi:uncharacterized protein BCR38DRAFT_332195 [Pseudomassariella vexata]|uniref:Rho-GAP domain-containing protein n=1 Tax=Pseudomassariella vexata TaxID=1141098 RepID=A0A1Y2EGT0_9PEZI|nr:uncharacterized protein BCR38DRAFT_332195 [Pseudomassariella vexata]ORY69995.1 hypothetical protein BCR38DRAFT_332195 [Pseudomassariella vexata]